MLFLNMIVRTHTRLFFLCSYNTETTTATLVAKEAGRDLREFNASDARSKKALQEQLGDLTGSQSLGFQIAGAKPKIGSNKKTLRCIIMDEVDGMGAGDRSGMAELIQMIKKSKVPIICICNDRQSQKMKSLLPYCMDLRFKRPTKNIMANRAVRIAQMEGLSVERNAAEAIAESCGNDVRQVLNVLQMWAQKKGGADDSLTYKSLKERESSINKDEILRVSLFDAAKTIMEGRKGLSGADAKTQTDSLFRRSDAFFVDYSFTGLLVQQNYPRVMQAQYGLVKKADNPVAELKFLNRMHDAAASMSDYAMIEHGIRNGDQNWSLLPATSMMAVKTGFHAGGKTGGFLPGYPEFTAWMGKNSSKNKKQRILNELHHHMNFKISADSQQLRESYLPVFRERFLTYFQGNDRSEEANEAVIELMDEYGLSREDVMEKLDEFQLAKKGEGNSFADLDSKQKAAFTRRYNQGSHKSQALVDEEFGSTKPKQGRAKRERDPHDLDAIDEDGDVEEESEGEDEEAELRKVQAKFKKKRKVVASKAAGKKGKKAK
jgi:replication factor C subunit 1